MVTVAADDGLRIVFDPALDRSAWPGPVPGVGAAFGEAWVGSRGLLGRLEGELCLGGIVPSRGERAARLLRRLNDTAGFWSRSLEADPLGTADRLLADRDELRMWGWRGEPVSPRLAALAEVTDAALPGIADRLEAVIGELEKLPTSIQRIEVAMREELLEPRWRSSSMRCEQPGCRLRRGRSSPRCRQAIWPPLALGRSLRPATAAWCCFGPTARLRGRRGLPGRWRLAARSTTSCSLGRTVWSRTHSSAPACRDRPVRAACPPRWRRCGWWSS